MRAFTPTPPILLIPATIEDMNQSTAQLVLICLISLCFPICIEIITSTISAEATSLHETN